MQDSVTTLDELASGDETQGTGTHACGCVAPARLLLPAPARRS
jgi:hypothetical protein